MSSHTCPVCGYAKLKSLPYSANGGGSYEICPACGFEFGVSDDDLGFTHAQWLKKWVAGGAKWSSTGTKAPKDWKHVPPTKAAATAKKSSKPAVKKTVESRAHTAAKKISRKKAT